jgi:hypothetical protein
MSTEDELAGSRYVRAFIEVENTLENSSVTYPVTSVALMVEGRRVRRSYHHVNMGNTSIIARSLGELRGVLREHFSDSALRCEIRVERSQRAVAEKLLPPRMRKIRVSR